MRAVIANGSGRKKRRRLDRQMYAIRYRVECFFHRLKRCRRVATRYEKTARNYLALVHLACALMWLA
jgi:transposase